MSIWSDMVTIVSATLSGDINFKVVQAYRSEAAWFVFGPLTLIGAILFYYRERFAERLEERLGYSVTKITHPIISVLLLLGMLAAFLPGINDLLLTLTAGTLALLVVFGPIILILFERTPERTIVIYCYIIMAAIIFIGVIQRFVFSVQVPWSTTIPPLLFMIMAWFGATFNIRLRTHLGFSEFRTKLGPKGQLFWLTFDNVLWLIFCIILVTTMSRGTVNTYDNFAIVLGTDDIMRWWFVVTMPVCFMLLATRALENVVEDFAKHKSGEPLIKQAVIGGDV
ncbi:TRAP transporter small permease subunit [Planktotalea sp.]|uniref:TRAP transporter small permease n=1 Tax=Planktotalea sp. TaxID=2029877 RepID=UPI0025E17CCD|nr:TRAP transporter small permease subunit [Planktotalea sp.]